MLKPNPETPNTPEQVEVIFISPDGDRTIKIYNENGIGNTGEIQKIKRASHLKWEKGIGWMADMSPLGGHVLGPYHTRREAIAGEQHYINTLPITQLRKFMEDE